MSGSRGFTGMPNVGKMLLLFFLAWIGMFGCITGKVMTLPGNPVRPSAQALQKSEAPPEVAVLDLSWEKPSNNEIGRDYDQVRAIVWKGNAGKTMADLVAGVLAEKGVGVIRSTGDAEVPAGVPAKVWGSVEGFRVNVKRVGTLKVEAEAVVSLRIFGSGGTAPPGWNSAVSTTYWIADPLFMTPDGALQAVNGAANSAAEESVRRLEEIGAVTIHKTQIETGTERIR